MAEVFYADVIEPHWYAIFGITLLLFLSLPLAAQYTPFTL
jgi:hypothetical protein